MTTSVPDSRSLDLRRLIGGLLVLVLVLIGGAAAPPTVAAQPSGAGRAFVSSHPRTAARHGVGLTLLGQWVGSWRLPEGSGFCVDFALDHPDSTGARRLGGGRVPGMTREQSRRAAFVASRYGRSRSTTDAAAAALVIWRLQHTQRFDRFYARLLATHALSDRVRSAVRRIEREARDHGPYRMTMTLATGAVGQQVSGTVRLRQHDGRGVASVPVRLAVARTAALVHTTRSTDAQGMLRFRLRVVRPGAVRVQARATRPATSTVLISRPTRGRQHLVVAGPGSEVITARASSLRTPASPSVTAVCDTDCDGQARVQVRATNPCGAATVRVLVVRDGTPVRGGSFDVAGCQSGGIAVTTPDGSAVTTRYCYLDARRRCSTAAVSFPGVLRVECPPRLRFRFSGECPCPGSTAIRYAVWAPAGSTRHYRARLTVDGQSAELMVVNGRWQSFAPVTLRAGAVVELSYEVLGRRLVLSRFQQLT